MALRIPLNWMRDFVEFDLSPESLAEKLTISGMEVESIEYLGKNWGDFCLVGSLLKVEPHPNANSLSLASVDYGVDQPLTVVTGAPKIRELEGKIPKSSLKVALALSGAELVDPYHEDHPLIRLKPSRIRGILSEGMICSELELGLSEKHEDILVLPEDAPTGHLLKDYLGDAILEFDIKGGFAHLLSILGIARETGAIIRKPLKREQFPDLARLQKEINPGFVELDIENPDLCPRYSALLIRDVSIGPSPFWMQQRLLSAGMRPINNIVDITNYVMLEYGQPLHAFDYQLLRKRARGATPKIIIRTAQNDEVLTTLDGEKRKLDDQMLLITDTAGPIAIAGVMGGTETEVSEETTEVLLESANFQFLNNRRTSQLLKLKTEASERFGKRIAPDGTLLAALRAAELFEQLSGGTLEPNCGDLFPGIPGTTCIELEQGHLERVLGVRLDVSEIVRILESLGFSVAGSEPLNVTVPSHRLDISIPSDLVEEIARVYGYNNLPATLIQDTLPPQRGNPVLDGVEQIRDLLTGAGLDEIITYSITNPLDESYLELQENFAPQDYVPVQNPLTRERSHMRKKILPGALINARNNLRYDDQVRVFETGNVFHPQEGKMLPNELLHLCLLMTGKRQQPSWHDSASVDIDFFDLKGVLENLLSSLHLKNILWKKARNLPFHPGRCAELEVEGVLIGVMGELHPEVRRLYDLPDQPIACAEFKLDELIRIVREDFQMSEISPYAPLYEDLAFLVDASLPAESMIPVIQKHGKPLLRQVRLFDVYQGEGIEKGKRSLGFSLTYQASDRTLKDKDVEKMRNRIIKSVENEFQASLRES